MRGDSLNPSPGAFADFYHESIKKAYKPNAKQTLQSFIDERQAGTKPFKTCMVGGHPIAMEVATGIASSLPEIDHEYHFFLVQEGAAAFQARRDCEIFGHCDINSNIEPAFEGQIHRFGWAIKNSDVDSEDQQDPLHIMRHMIQEPAMQDCDVWVCSETESCTTNQHLTVNT